VLKVSVFGGNIRGLGINVKINAGRSMDRGSHFCGMKYALPFAGFEPVEYTF
jgi:hypothetical protein